MLGPLRARPPFPGTRGSLSLPPSHPPDPVRPFAPQPLTPAHPPAPLTAPRPPSLLLPHPHLTASPPLTPTPFPLSGLSPVPEPEPGAPSLSPPHHHQLPSPGPICTTVHPRREGSLLGRLPPLMPPPPPGSSQTLESQGPKSPSSSGTQGSGPQDPSLSVSSGVGGGGSGPPSACPRGTSRNWGSTRLLPQTPRSRGPGPTAREPRGRSVTRAPLAPRTPPAGPPRAPRPAAPTCWYPCSRGAKSLGTGRSWKSARGSWWSRCTQAEGR